jgi:hypothetical protein
MAGATRAFAASPYVSVVGWEGDKDAAIIYADGSFTVRDGVNADVRFGIYTTGTPLDWHNAEGHLPALVTAFDLASTHVEITSFGDDVTIGGNEMVVVYSRVAIVNNGASAVTADPAPSTTPGLVALTNNSTTVAAGQTVQHDFAIVVDRFGQSFARPADADLIAAGGFDTHYAHMKDYWNARLAKIVDIKTLPDPRLIDAYKAGFILTHIVKDGLDLNVGENGYDQIFDHDLLGITNSLFVLGDFQDAQALLSSVLTHVRPGSGYRDALWKVSLPWATYLMKTGDLAFVQQNFDAISSRTHAIDDDRSGPGGIMLETFDIDASDYWTTDDWAALLGLSTYRYLANAVGNATEVAWADMQYDALFAAIDSQIATTVANNQLSYLPCSALASNDQNRCGNPTDANWMSMSIIGMWAWDGFLWGAKQDGTMLSLVDDTYDWGFQQAQATGLPAHTYGGYPGYGTAYNAGYGMSGLRGTRYRDEAMLDYLFMLDGGQSGPFSWWEGELEPSASDWMGTHPSNGSGSCPHMWGQSFAFRALLDSLVAEKSDGTVLIGRGVPVTWAGQPIEIDNVPIANNGRMGATIGGDATDVTLTLTGDMPSKVQFGMPAFQNRICSASAGTVSSTDGYVELPAGTTSVSVHVADTCPPSMDAGCELGHGLPGGGAIALVCSLLVLSRRRRRANSS